MMICLMGSRVHVCVCVMCMCARDLTQHPNSATMCVCKLETMFQPTFCLSVVCEAVGLFSERSVHLVPPRHATVQKLHRIASHTRLQPGTHFIM